MSRVSPIIVDTLDLSEAADKIRPTNAALADLLDAVADIETEPIHIVVEYSESESECADDCPPCVAMYAARMVAAQFLSGGESR